MKKSFLFRIAKFFMILTLMFMIFNNVVVIAFDVKGTFDGTITTSAKASVTSVQDVLITALTAIRVAGMAIAIIMLIVVGIKIMIASPGEKANIKQYMMNYVIGAFILLGASGILTIVQGVAKSAFVE